MEDFRGSDTQYARLRTALRDLYEANVKSGQLERLVTQEALRMGVEAISRTDIDKFRKGEVDRPRDFRKIIPLWTVVFSPKFLLPTADGDRPEPSNTDGGPHEFFHAAHRFFDVNKEAVTDIQHDLPGRFQFYHFSEYFHKFSTIQRAVVVGQWDISLSDGTYLIDEQQRYDGHIGKQPMREAYAGYCLPKGENICLFLKESKRQTPKFYMLETVYSIGATKVYAGYMLKGSLQQKFFHSPVYAVRVPDGRAVDCNILRCEDTPAHVMDELEALSSR